MKRNSQGSIHSSDSRYDFAMKAGRNKIIGSAIIASVFCISLSLLTVMFTNTSASSLGETQTFSSLIRKAVELKKKPAPVSTNKAKDELPVWYVRVFSHHIDTTAKAAVLDEQPTAGVTIRYYTQASLAIVGISFGATQYETVFNHPALHAAFECTTNYMGACSMHFDKKQNYVAVAHIDIGDVNGDGVEDSLYVGKEVKTGKVADYGYENLDYFIYDQKKEGNMVTYYVPATRISFDGNATNLLAPASIDTAIAQFPLFFTLVNQDKKSPVTLKVDSKLATPEVHVTGNTEHTFSGKAKNDLATFIITRDNNASIPAFSLQSEYKREGKTVKGAITTPFVSGSARVSKQSVTESASAPQTGGYKMDSFTVTPQKGNLWNDIKGMFTK